MTFDMNNNLLVHTLFKYFDFGDNIALQYFFNIALLAIIPAFSTQGIALLTWIKQKLWSWLYPVQPPEEYASITLSARHGFDGKIESTREVNAWLWHIRTKVVPMMTDEGTREVNHLVQERNRQKGGVRQTNWNQQDTDRKDPDTSWWPMDLRDAEIYNGITCSFNNTEVKQPQKQQNDGLSKKRRHQGGQAETSSGHQSVSKITLKTDLNKGPDYLIKITEQIAKAYDNSLLETLMRGPQIFYYDHQRAQNVRSYKMQPNFKMGNYSSWESIPFSSTRQLDHIWFEQKDTFMRAYSNFLDNKTQYEHRGDPYTFSALLYGEPGCGKTSLLKALVNHDVQRDQLSHLFVVPIAEIADEQTLRMIMFDPQIGEFHIPLDRRIYIFEDFDAGSGADVFYKRELLKERKQQKKRKAERKKKRKEEDPEYESSDEEDEDQVGFGGKGQGLFGHNHVRNTFNKKLSLSSVLNILDGVTERTGMRCFWTTNVWPPEKYFDPAFLRPGRMDMIIEFTKCSKNGLAYLINQYFQSEINVEALGDVDDYRLSPAELKQLCKQSDNVNMVITALQKLTIAARNQDEEAKRAQEAERLEREARRKRGREEGEEEKPSKKKKTDGEGEKEDLPVKRTGEGDEPNAKKQKTDSKQGTPQAPPTMFRKFSLDSGHQLGKVHAPGRNFIGGKQLPVKPARQISDL